MFAIGQVLNDISSHRSLRNTRDDGGNPSSEGRTQRYSRTSPALPRWIVDM